MTKDKNVGELVDMISEMIIKYIAEGRDIVNVDETENLQVA